MASPRRPATALRSGRIKADDVVGANALTIVSAVTGPFRIFNTGENDFNVKPTAQDSIVLKPRSSVDVRVNGDIVIDRTATGAVKGFYEYIDPFTSLRGGKFKGLATPALTIVQNRGDAVFYRILNSHKTNNFEVRVGTTLITTLEPRFSIDVAAGAKVTITRATLPVVGIYDYLDSRNVIQSGRFSITMAATDRHKIIDHTGGARRVYYRIFNSGEEPFVVRRGTTAITPRVRPDQSLDFDIPSSGDKIITVSPVTGTKLIEGIYDFLDLGE